ncbi:MAG: Heimdall-CTERM domain-containing surface protein [Candidatus Hodarchaeota archaeon]
MKKRLISTAIVLSIIFVLVSSTAATDITNPWGPAIAPDVTFEWKITKLKDENGASSWKWGALDHTLELNDIINTTIVCACKNALPVITASTVGVGVPIREWINVETYYDGALLNPDKETPFLAFILPVYLEFSNATVSGMNVMAGYFHDTYPMPAGLPAEPVAEFVWSLSVDGNTAELNKVGEDANDTAEVTGHIVSATHQYYTNGTWIEGYSAEDPNKAPVIVCFDVTYSARHGVLTKLTYPSTVEQTLGAYDVEWPAVAHNATPLTENLAELEIVLQTELEDAPADGGAAPGFELWIALAGFAVLTVLVYRRRR